MKGPRTPAIVALAVCVAACFDIASTSDGKAVRVNRLTGELVLIENSTYRPIELKVADLDSLGRSGDSAQRLISGARFWPRDSIPQIGARIILLATRCRSGRVDYRITITPVPRRYEVSGATPFTFHMEDDAGFQLVDESISTSVITRLVDGSGRATGLSIAGSAVLSVDECVELSSWGLAWRF